MVNLQCIPLMLIVVATPASAALGPPAYDEELAVKGMQVAIATYAGFHSKARFAAVSSLNCKTQNCSLPSTFNVSFFQHREALNGGVVAAGMVARDNEDDSIIVSFGGASMLGHGILDYPSIMLTKLTDFNVDICPGPVQTEKDLIRWYKGLRGDMIQLLQAYAMDSDGAENVTLRLLGYSSGSVLGMLAALDIKSLIASGKLPSFLKMAPVHMAGQLPMFDQAFIDCYTKMITNVTGHFAIHHGRDPMGFIQVTRDRLECSDGPCDSIREIQSNNAVVRQCVKLRYLLYSGEGIVP